MHIVHPLPKDRGFFMNLRVTKRKDGCRYTEQMTGLKYTENVTGFSVVYKRNLPRVCRFVENSNYNLSNT